MKYQAMGWSVLCCCPPDHAGVGKGHSQTCENPGKRPWGYWTEFMDRPMTVAELLDLWKRMPGANVGIALGPVSGLIRIDIEGPLAEALLLEKSKGILPPTLEFKSGRSDGTGRGLLYLIPAGAVLKTTPINLREPKQELRFQAKGAMTVLPPSRHPDGNLYIWRPGYGPDEIEAALAPAWLVQELAIGANGRNGHFSGKSLENWKQILDGAEEGFRNTGAASVAGRLLGMMADIESDTDLKAAWQFLCMWNDHNTPPLGDDELATTFGSIHKAERTKRRDRDPLLADRNVSSQIAECTHPPSGASNGQVRPPWHLVILESDPVEYLLRSPFWSESPLLKDGYLRLAKIDILSWGKISAQALWQSRVEVPVKLEEWRGPGGHLEKLLDAAEVRPVICEDKRPIFILGFLYRFLLEATNPRRGANEKPILPTSGHPTRWENESVVFQLAFLKKRVKDSGEDFRQKEMTTILGEYGITAKSTGQNRWWVASKEAIETIGRASGELP